MQKINLNLDKKKKYVVACSFGPDSMALLHLAIKEGLDIVVAHVNYRKREAAVFEQESLERFCKDNNVKIYVLDLLGKKPVKNFQNWARKTRYEFFKEVLIKEQADAVLVAHQEDDVIETYIMQKKRGNFVKNPGISYENEVFGVKIIRPLLAYSKRSLQQYDEENNVPFAIDQSNLTDHYERNKVRHHVVEKMSEKERREILKEISSKEKCNIKPKSEYSIKEFLNFDYENTVLIIDYFMQKTNKHRNLSEKFIMQIKNAFLNKSTHRVKISESLWLEKDYDTVYFVNASKIRAYEVAFETRAKIEFISVDFSNGAKDRGIQSKNAKFVLKNLDKNDKYIIKDYVSRIRRLFIDWKMPLFLREIWPGIYDENGSLIYVPRYRENFVDNHESKFEINTKYFTEF